VRCVKPAESGLALSCNAAGRLSAPERARAACHNTAVHMPTSHSACVITLILAHPLINQTQAPPSGPTTSHQASPRRFPPAT
jgi:hypothetical protein